MGIAISEDHRELEAAARGFLQAQDARGITRAQLNGAADSGRPKFWSGMNDMGWFGLHLPEEFGGSGFGIEELAIVVEAMGRAVAPGMFVPTVTASAVINGCGDASAKKTLLPALAVGDTTATVAIVSGVLNKGKLSGNAGTVLGAPHADLIVVIDGDDVAVISAKASGVSVTSAKSVDVGRTSGTVTFKDAKADHVFAGAGRMGRALAWTVLSAEATGIATECTEMATEYAKVRQQFGRPIAMFQAVKHHCANMLVASEIATANTWDAARSANSAFDQFEVIAASAAAVAFKNALQNTHMNIQVHGGIGFTWEHDAHLLMRRALTLHAIFDNEAIGAQVVASTKAGVVKKGGIDLGPAEPAIRAEVKKFVDGIKGLDAEGRKLRLIDEGYMMPHWPKPFGREASAIEQIIIDEELSAAGIERLQYGITAWNILTLLQHGNPSQIQRWVRDALEQKVIWCQLFSEPDAGSDAAGVKTKATRVDGGWLVNGQKVWTSGAHYAKWGFATIRTDSTLGKHRGVTMMVIDMEAPGVEVRPLKQITGNSEFNEVFFNDVFVPDDDVVGKVDDGWTVARATLGNERVSIGGGVGAAAAVPGKEMVDTLERTGKSSNPVIVDKVGRHIAIDYAMRGLNGRSVFRAVGGNEPGPEGNITKLLGSEHGHERAWLLLELQGGEVAFLEGPGEIAALATLATRGMSIAGGTSEIARNQIGERILGLPRDPLLK